MSHTYEATIETMLADGPGLVKRTAVLFYGVASYTIGMTGLMWLILACGGLAPSGLGAIQNVSNTVALAINAGLIALLGLQHSVMARQSFKDWITRYIPTAMERPTFVLMSGVVTSLAIYFWQSLPGVAWSVENTIAQGALWTLYALGWGYLVMATFITNHFELMGLRQVYLYFTRQEYTRLQFTRQFMYRYSRHPMMLGILVGMWAIPSMSVSHLALAVLLTIYTAVGMYFEERDLIKTFGDTYRQYRKDIATFIPKVF